jgi:magnesium-transporting ATPase (P-type)
MKTLYSIVNNIFHNTLGSILSTIILAVFLPTANVLNNQPIKEKENMFLNPQFIASCIISLFLVILFNLCRYLVLKIDKTEEQLKVISLGEFYKLKI